MFAKFHALALAGMAFLVLAGAALAQDGQRPPATSGLGETINQGTVGIIAGDFHSTSIRMSSDMGAVLDDGEKLRILAIAGKGSIQSILDLLYLQGIDVGIVQLDVLEYFRDRKVHSGIESALRYAAKLHNEEVHILVRDDIDSLEDLAGKPVNFGLPGSGNFITASLIFGTLKIGVQPRGLDLNLALEKLKTGEIAGLVEVVGKPGRSFEKLSAAEGVKLLPLPREPKLLERYLPARITAEDYPGLVASDQPVATLAVGTAMVVYNWQRGQSRYGKVRRFVEAFFDRIDDFQAPGRHPKWSEVNLRAEIPGWRRFGPAEDWLKARAAQVAKAEAQEQAAAELELREAFTQFLRESADSPTQDPKLSGNEDVEALFQQFLEWSSETR